MLDWLGLLDIGCGWGALVLYAAKHYGVDAVGITLSENQARLANERVRHARLQDRVAIHLLDYRDLPRHYPAGSFDKIASVGMFEHVGLRNLPEYFGIAARMLRDRGLFLNHGITSSDVDSRPVGSGVGEFISRHVFPHGELPHLNVAVRAMSAAGFEITDVESLRPHYARTLAPVSAAAPPAAPRPPRAARRAPRGRRGSGTSARRSRRSTRAGSGARGR
jgi:cyclopropane-fatty-acyl-phospholipid synthase